MDQSDRILHGNEYNAEQKQEHVPRKDDTSLVIKIFSNNGLILILLVFCLIIL